MSLEISQFFQVFFDEAEELLAEKERLLLGLDPAAFDMADIDAIFRVAHSIKGGAATFGLADMTGVTHVLESLLDRLRKGEMALTGEQIDVFLQSKDVLQMLLRVHRDGETVDQPAVDTLLARLQALSAGDAMAGGAASGAVGGTDAVISVTATATSSGAMSAAMPGPVSSLSATGASPVAGTAPRNVRITMPEIADKDVAALADELGLLGSVTVSTDDAGHKVFLLATAESIDDISALCAFVVDPASLQIVEECQPAYEIFHLPVRQEAASLAAGAGAAGSASAAGKAAKHAASQASAHAAQPGAAKSAERGAPAGAESSSIRVSVEKVDQLINLVGELVITQAMIEQRTHGLDPMLHEKLLNGVSQLTRNTRHLQEAVMSIRMMPMDYVFSRFPRMVRDLAAKLGKKVDFVTQGAATELDKGLIERIIDPLTHLVRNSIDHGIEMPSVRSAVGKDAAGRLTLSAMHRGGHVVIEVSDDGGGLQRERILAKAKQQGIAVPDSITDAEVWQLIFAPGFSTAETVTDVSGRGVGMDVVKRNITSLGGQVEIRSVAGVGTTVSIALPLTLAILDGMSVRSGEEVYILPLNYVLESLQPRTEDVSDIAGHGQVIRVRGEYLSLISLRQTFATGDISDAPSGIAVILEADGQKAALLIDELVGQQQVVVKNLEANYRRVAGISGATILGDGSVALILDVSALLRGARSRTV